MIELEKLLEVIADGLDVEQSSVNIDTKSSNVEEWDSLGHLTLLMKLDEEFDDISEKIPEMASAGSIQEIYDLIKKNNF